jgi:hypothetical protein
MGRVCNERYGTRRQARLAYRLAPVASFVAVATEKPTLLGVNRYNAAAMRPIEQDHNHEFRALLIYREDLDFVLSEMTATCAKVTIADKNNTYDSLDDAARPSWCNCARPEPSGNDGMGPPTRPPVRLERFYRHGAKTAEAVENCLVRFDNDITKFEWFKPERLRLAKLPCGLRD